MDQTGVLRALSHPLRPRLLTALREGGPSTASQLASRFELSSGDTSYHLRQLERFGLIEEDMTRGSGRDRYWRASAPETSLDVARVLSTPEGREAMRAAQQQRLAIHSIAIDAVLVDERVPAEWLQTVWTSDYRLLLSLAEVEQLVAEVHRVVERYRGRESTPDRRTVRVAFDAVPLADDS